MRRGDFAAAWRLSDREPPPSPDEWRKPRHVQRIWDGRPFAGERVLVRCYHGLGDTVQFARFLPRLARIARALTVWMPPALMPIFASMAHDHGFELLALHDGAPEVPYDVDVEIMELAYAWRVQPETLGATVPYLPSSPADPDGLPRVALGWRGGGWDVTRHLPVAEAARIVDRLPCEIVALPPGPTGDERARLPDARWAGDLTDVARHIARADLVISVDTVFAHLAGAMGTPLHLVLPERADWRWMEGRDTSPWYPSARLFRQRTGTRWDDVTARVRAATVAFLSATTRAADRTRPA